MREEGRGDGGREEGRGGWDIEEGGREGGGRDVGGGSEGGGGGMTDCYTYSNRDDQFFFI